MAIHQLIRLDLDGTETVLEETPVPDDWNTASWWCPLSHIKKLEEHYKKTGKPKKSLIDVIYMTRRQTERED